MTFSKLGDNMQGIWWMIGSCAAMAIITLATRYASDGLNIYMLCTLVYLVALPIGSLYIIKKPLRMPRTTRWKMYMLRGVTGVSSYILFSYGITKMTIADVSAIVFTSPLFGVILAIMFMKEKATPARIIALIIGFVGAMVVIQPGSLNFNIASLAVLASSFIYAIVHLSIKSLTRTDGHNVIAFYTQLSMFLMSLPIAIIFWQTPTPIQFFWCAVVGVFWHASIFCMSKSYEKADVVVVMPFQFMRLVFVVILGAVVLNEPTEIYTIVGSIIILASAIYAARKEMAIGPKP
jgi:drug/metabolite transporter (DMT)-like permease